MESLKCFVLLIIFVFAFVNGVAGNCILSLNKDFGNPSPVFLQDGGYLAPNLKNGDISISKNGVVQASCPGTGRHVILGDENTDFQFVEARCISNSTFRVGRWIGHLANITCNSQPWFTTEEAGGCGGRHKLYRVGYMVQNVLRSLYEACFDGDLLHTVFTRHQLTPAAKFTQTSRRPQFIEGSLFSNTKMNDLYKSKNQKARLNTLLGDDMDKEYINKNQFLTRGHLAPRADFPLRAQQRASFHYVNTAPQWMRGNAGDWAALEDALRRRVFAQNCTLIVLTGTHGLLTLTDKRGREASIYLSTDVNNNNVVPVPLYFYKLVYDATRKSAAVFISINSSYYNSSTIKALTFCSDICEQNTQYSWLKWRSSDGTFSFCCDYDEFIQTVNYLPSLDVKERFY